MVYDFYKGFSTLLTIYSGRNKNKKAVASDYQKFFASQSQNNVLKKQVDLDKVTKVYQNGIKAINNLSLTIEPGEFVVLLGPSGCGKTTLLRMIAGLESISAGYIKFNEAIINGIPSQNREIAMVFQNYALYPFMSVYDNIAFGLKNKIFANDIYRQQKIKIKKACNFNYDKIKHAKTIIHLNKRINPELNDQRNQTRRLLKTAKIYKDQNKISQYQAELAKINQQIKKSKEDPHTQKIIDQEKKKIINLKTEAKKHPPVKEEIKKLIDEKYAIAKAWNSYIPQKVEAVTKMLGINMYIKRKPAELSGGQRQRVALARAISKQSGLFLYDEPLSNLDAKLRAKMRSEIRMIHENLGATSVYVTHDQIEAMSMADKVVVMNKGYIQQIGTPLELLEKPHNLFVAKFIGNTEINLFKAQYLKDNKFQINKKSTLVVTIAQKLKTSKIKMPKEIILGIRPEHIIIEPQIVNNYQENKFTGKIKKSELLGNEVLLTIESPQLGKLNLLSNISYQHKIGETITFIVNPNKIHAYDHQTGFNFLANFNQQNNHAKAVWLEHEEDRKKNIYLMNKEKHHLSPVSLIRLSIWCTFSKAAREKWQERKRDIEYGDQIKAI